MKDQLRIVAIDIYFLLYNFYHNVLQFLLIDWLIDWFIDWFDWLIVWLIKALEDESTKVPERVAVIMPLTAK